VISYTGNALAFSLDTIRMLIVHITVGFMAAITATGDRAAE